MKDKSSSTLEISPPEGVNISDIPAVVREGFLSYLQTGVVSDDAVEENVMELMGLAYQHQVDSLVEHCSSLTQENLDDENLEIVLEFIKNRHLPSLRWACLEFMLAHPENIPEGLTKDDQEVLNLLKVLPYTIELKMSTQGKLKVNVTKLLYSSNIEYLEKINKKSPISSVRFLTIQLGGLAPINKLGGLALINKMSQKFKNIEELIINDPTFKLEKYINILEQFPKLTAFGNDAPFLLNFDEVKVYLENFRNPEEKEADSSLKKLTIRSLNLSAIRNLTDAQLEELTPYLQEIYHLFINSDKITKLIAPKASRVYCYGCTSLKTLQANQVEWINCSRCTSLKTLQANQAKSIDGRYCTNLETLQADQAEWVYCRGCKSLITLQANQAELVDCRGCKSLNTLQANKAKLVYCSLCTSLDTLEVNQAIEVDCSSCTSLKTLQANQAETVNCSGCTSLETLEANQAKEVNCKGCTSLKPLKQIQKKNR